LSLNQISRAVRLRSQNLSILLNLNAIILRLCKLVATLSYR